MSLDGEIIFIALFQCFLSFPDNFNFKSEMKLMFTDFEIRLPGLKSGSTIFWLRDLGQ